MGYSSLQSYGKLGEGAVTLMSITSDEASKTKKPDSHPSALLNNKSHRS